MEHGVEELGVSTVTLFKRRSGASAILRLDWAGGYVSLYETLPTNESIGIAHAVMADGTFCSSGELMGCPFALGINHLSDELVEEVKNQYYYDHQLHSTALLGNILPLVDFKLIMPSDFVYQLFCFDFQAARTTPKQKGPKFRMVSYTAQVPKVPLAVLLSRPVFRNLGPEWICYHE